VHGAASHRALHPHMRQSIAHSASCPWTAQHRAVGRSHQPHLGCRSRWGRWWRARLARAIYDRPPPALLIVAIALAAFASAAAWRCWRRARCCICSGDADRRQPDVAAPGRPRGAAGDVHELANVPRDTDRRRPDAVPPTRPRGAAGDVRAATRRSMEVLPPLGGGGRLTSTDRNPPRLGFLRFRQRQRQHPIIELRADPFLIDLVGQRE
jgi:hypothetical protein